MSWALHLILDYRSPLLYLVSLLYPVAHGADSTLLCDVELHADILIYMSPSST